ncbi:hypothetical protein OAX78_01560 [Planctomycetota bacterium]|nr:hypothetical protein [Planctomycetota bacterium]
MIDPAVMKLGWTGDLRRIFRGYDPGKQKRAPAHRTIEVKVCKQSDDTIWVWPTWDDWYRIAASGGQSRLFPVRVDRVTPSRGEVQVALREAPLVGFIYARAAIPSSLAGLTALRRGDQIKVLFEGIHRTHDTQELVFAFQHATAPDAADARALDPRTGLMLTNDGHLVRLEAPSSTLVRFSRDGLSGRVRLQRTDAGYRIANEPQQRGAVYLSDPDTVNHRHPAILLDFVEETGKWRNLRLSSSNRKKTAFRPEHECFVQRVSFPYPGRHMTLGTRPYLGSVRDLSRLPSSAPLAGETA